MTEKTIVVGYYFDYFCPWTYLSFKRLIQTTTRTASVINWKPILLADIEQELGSIIDPKIPHPSGIKYETQDLQDWANYCGLKITPRNDGPKNVSKKALCGAFCAIKENKITDYSGLVFDAYFGGLKDISNNEVLTEIATKLELDPTDYESAINSTVNLKRLKNNATDLIERGGFGSPTMFVEDDMYYGNDRIPLVEFSIGRASGKILVLPGQHDT